MRESASFKIEIRSEDSAYLYSKQDIGMTITNTEANTIETAEVSASVAVLGADSSYTVDFIPKNPLPIGAII